MPWKVQYLTRFSHALRSLRPADSERIITAIDRLISDMNDGRDAREIRKLTGARWRLRVGVWRVFFSLADGTIFIEHVERRSSKTY